jgi:drug/metabolite transporter (DMT)-like permease
VTIIGLILVTRLPLINSENNNPVINSTININNTFIEQNSTSNQNYNRIIGISTGILSTVFVALNYIVLQKAKKAETNVVLFNLGWVALVELSLITLALKGYSLPSGSHEWSMIGLLMVCSYTGQCFATKSLRVEHCSPIAVIGAPIDILLGFVWQIALFSDEKIDAWSISGGLLVALCIILITFRKYIKSLPHNSKVKLMFNFMTK